MDYNDADDLRKYQADDAERPSAQRTQHLGEFLATYPNGMAARVASSDDPPCPFETDGYRCAYPAGHAPLMVDGVQYEHHVPGKVSWSPDAERCPGIALDGIDGPRYCASPVGHADACRDAQGQPIIDESTPLADESDAEQCPSTVPHDPAVRCVRPAGHPGLHAAASQLGDGTIRWATEAGEYGTGDVLHEMISKALRDDRVRVVAGLPDCSHGRAAGPVRVRFVDLPSRHERREVFGIAGTVAEPGGFALVVDRFKHLAHLEGERVYWQDFGATIGARYALLYPGELDIVGWLDGTQ